MNPDRYAVIGNPVNHSRSPQIHAAFARQTDARLQYDRLTAALDAFAPTVQEFFAAGGSGLNVTVPFKEEAWQLAQTHLSERARLAGAVNTLWLQTGELHGCNTDGIGLLRDLQHLGAPLQGASILLIGAGGAARGVVAPLLDAGCAELRIVNRTPERAQQLIQHFSPLPTAHRLQAGSLQDASRRGGWDLLINATASSLSQTAPALPEQGIWRTGAWAYDMMYGTAPTPFLALAQQQGLHTADGLGMLVEQAAESFRLWRGTLPSTAPVRAALRQALAQGLAADAPLSS